MDTDKQIARQTNPVNKADINNEKIQTDRQTDRQTKRDRQKIDDRKIKIEINRQTLFLSMFWK